jgi:triosephosphate isomerase
MQSGRAATRTLRSYGTMGILPPACEEYIMRKKLVAGNWKMHGNKTMVNALLKALLARTATDDPVDLAVFPPFPYLQRTQKLLRGSPIAWGGQTLNPASQGAFTGEVSASMLLDFGCRYVLIGHSERRTLFGESDSDIALRFEAAQLAGLEPISAW